MKQVSNISNIKHLVFIDYLRVFSCIAVIFLHIIVSWSDGSGLTVSEYPLRLRVDTAVAEVLRVAVPIFVMISGALLLDKEKQITWGRIWKYIARALLVLAIFGLGFSLVETIMGNGLNVGSILLAIKNTFEEKTWGHMWYMYMLIGLYILTPIIKAYTDRADKKELLIAVAMLLGVSSVIPTINWVIGSEITSFRLEWMLYPAYYMLGQLLYRHTPSRSISAFATLVSSLVLFYMGLFTDHYLTGPKHTALPEVILAAALFSLLKNMDLHSNRLVLYLSKCSFCIYIIHVVFVHLAEIVFKMRLEMTPIFIGEIISVFAVFSFSLLSTVLIRKVPILKEII